MIYANEKYYFFIGEIERGIKFIKSPGSNRQTAFKD